METNNILATIIRFREEAIENLKSSRWYDEKDVDRLRAIPIVINTRMRTAGGSMRWKIMPYTRHASDLRLDISSFHVNHSTEEIVRNTVMHEYAHGYHVIRTHSTDHSFMWQMIHQAMGGNGSRTHNSVVKRNCVTRHKIVDNRTGRLYTVSTRKWNQVRNWTYTPVGGTSTAVFTEKETFTRGGEITA